MSNQMDDKNDAERKTESDLVNNSEGGKKILIYQELILGKFVKYLDVLSNDPKYKSKYDKNLSYVRKIKRALGEGHCNGLTALWLYRKARGESSLFHGNLKLISSWDEKVESLEETDNFLFKIFEETLSAIRWGQDDTDLLKRRVKIKSLRDTENHVEKLKNRYLDGEKITQNDLDQILEMIKCTNDSSIAQEVMISFVFKKNEFNEYLDKIITEGKMITLSSNDHVVGVMMVNGKYCYYDPNYDEGEREYDTLDQLLDDLLPDLYQDFEDQMNLEARICVFDWSKKIPGSSDDFEDFGVDLIEKYLDNNNDINRRGAMDIASMNLAAYDGNAAILSLLIKKGADINIEDSFSLTPLMLACQNGNTECIRILLQQPNIFLGENYHGKTPLHVAIENGKLEAVKLLFTKMQMNTPEKIETALYLCKRHKKDDITQYLIKNKTIPNILVYLKNFVEDGKLDLVKSMFFFQKIDLNILTELKTHAENCNSKMVPVIETEIKKLHDKQNRGLEESSQNRLIFSREQDNAEEPKTISDQKPSPSKTIK